MISLPFGDEFKEMEVYSKIQLNEGQSFIARLDGWAFHTFVKEMYLERPYDICLPNWMETAAREVFPPFKPKLCYFFSDELSFIFRGSTIFKRIEKIDSLLASFFSSEFSRIAQKTAPFDCRIIPIEWNKVSEYLRWRQGECIRNYNNGWAEWVMTKKLGYSPAVAAKKLSGMKAKELIQLCKDNKVPNFGSVGWQKTGMLLYAKKAKKDGFNPITRENVVVERIQIVKGEFVPNFATQDGKELLQSILGVQ